MDVKKFTLVELLIVVAIIGILVSLLLPSLSKSKELGRRAVCLSNLKQCGIMSILYASDNSGTLNPSSGMNDINDGVHWLGSQTIAGFKPYVGSWEITDCPNWGSVSLAQGMTPVINGAAMVGYIYTGGIRTATLVGPGEDWVAPQRLSDSSNLILWAERIVTSNNWTAKYPHSATGWRVGPTGVGINPGLNGSEGGNQLDLSGAARWRSQKEMTGQKGASTATLTNWWKQPE